MTTATATKAEMPAEEAPLDPAAQMDSLHILPLRIIPLKLTALKSANLIKNARLETVVEVFRNDEGASGQVTVDDVWKTFGADPDDPALAKDRQMLSNLAGLYSYDIYTLRKVLRALGVTLDEHEALKLSPAKAAELNESMRDFTRPLLAQVFSGMETEITEFDELINLFKSPDKAAALKNLQIMSEKLQIELMEIPTFLEDYGDIFLSLAYFRNCLDDLIPQITSLMEDMEEIRESHQLRSDRNLMKTCDMMEERMTDITTSLTGRFESFHQHSNRMWQNVTAESFKAVREMVASHHMTLGGVLCGLAVKMSLWELRFSQGRGSLTQRAEFIMTEMRHGVDTIDRIEKSAPTLTALND